MKVSEDYNSSHPKEISAQFAIVFEAKGGGGVNTL